MTTKFLTPIPPKLYFIFGEPELGKAVYEQSGSFDEAQAWFRALRRVVGEVIALPSVSLFVPVSRNAIHKRIKEGNMSCFKFEIKDTDSEVSNSLNRERPHAFVPVSECKAWFKEYHDRSTMKYGNVPATVTADQLYGDWDRAYDHHSRKYEGIWEKAFSEFQKNQMEENHNKALANLPESERKKYGK